MDVRFDVELVVRSTLLRVEAVVRLKGQAILMVRIRRDLSIVAFWGKCAIRCGWCELLVCVQRGRNQCETPQG